MTQQSRPIYLDHNATTPLAPEALEAMLPYLKEEFGNPSSGHVYGKRAREAVERARGQVARFLGCSPWEVIFTGGGTEANNLAIVGCLRARRDGRRQVVTSAIEHAAVQSPCERLTEEGYEVSIVGVDAEGILVESQWRDAISARTALVSVMHANNEVGAQQPIAAIAAHAREHGAVVHVDAAQSAGKIPVKVQELGVDLLTLVGHKFYGPKGVGVLYIRSGTPLRPLIAGAGHELGFRPGTENVAGIVGLGVAAELAGARLDEESARLAHLRDALERALCERIPELVVNGPREGRLCNTLNVSFPGVSGAAVLRRAPGIAASTGSACHGEDESAVLAAMGLPPERARGAVRLSLGRLTGPSDVERAVELLHAAWREAAAGVTNG